MFSVIFFLLVQRPKVKQPDEMQGRVTQQTCPDIHTTKCVGPQIEFSFVDCILLHRGQEREKGDIREDGNQGSRFGVKGA